MKEVGATWTEERVEQLKKLWEEGLSASRIATAMGGVTRNAVIGKVHRLGLSGRAKTKGSSTPRPRKKASEATLSTVSTMARTTSRTTSTRSANSTSSASPSLKPMERVSFTENYKFFAASAMPECEHVTIMDLNDYICRWPLGDPSTPEFRFCGGESVSGMPYCAYHCAMAYQPAQERKRDRKTA